MRTVSVFNKHRLAGICGFLLLPSFASAEPGFPPALFPGLADKSEADIRLAGIAALNPGRVLDRDPVAPKPAVPEMRKTLAAELPRGGEYLRLYTLDREAVRVRAGKKPLIVDCRYLATTPADLDACLALGGALGGPAAVSFGGTYPGGPEATGLHGSVRQGVLSENAGTAKPTVVLVNGLTSGPLEAVLAALQAKKKILIVGMTTAGLTGAYRRAGDRWILAGEVKPDEATTLVGTGLVPKFPVKAAPQDEFRAWQLVERGASLATVSRHDGLGSTSASAKAAESDKAGAADATDAALQRAQDVLAALAVLDAETK